MATSSDTVIKTLDNLHVMPQPERLSELYFNDYATLPVSAPIGDPQTIAFTVHNLEHQTTDYHYQIIIQLPDSTASILHQGKAVMNHNQAQTITSPIAMPMVAGRAKLTVRLTYVGTPIGELSPRHQTQSISYWVNLIPKRTGDKT